MPEADWATAAGEINTGWRVRRYGQTGGAFSGRVAAAASFSDRSLTVPVVWEFVERQVEETLHEPSWRRSLSWTDESVVIGSPEGLLVFKREDCD